MTDEDTLSAQLSGLMGRITYNAAGMDRTEPVRINAIADRLGMQSGYLIFEFLERDFPPPLPIPPARFPGYRGWVRENLSRIKVAYKGWYKVSPLRVLSERSYRMLQNDRFLPNTFARRVVIGTFRNGDTTLFLPKELRLHKENEVVKVVEYFTWFRDELRKRNLTLLVLLVPNKYTVYAPLLKEPIQPAYDMNYLTQLEKQLQEVGVSVVNPASRFRESAAREFDQRKYIYFHDDTHWNPAGIRLCAEQVRDVILQLEAKREGAGTARSD